MLFRSIIQRQNAGVIDAFGVEGDASWRASDTLSFNAAFALTSASVNGGTAAPQLTGKRPAQTPRWTITAGAVTTPVRWLTLMARVRYESERYADDLNTLALGFASFVSHSGGPPFQIYTLPQRMEKLVFAGTSTIFFAILNILKIAPYWALGQFNPGNLAYAAALSPIAVGGAHLGYRATRWLPEKFFFRLVEAVLFLLSLKLIHDGLQGLP